MIKIISAVLLSIAVMLMASCSVDLKGENNAATNLPASSGSNAAENTSAGPSGSPTADMPASPDESSAGTMIDSAAANSADSSGQSTAVTVEQPADSGITLESVKQAAIDAGYPAEDIQDLQLDTDPKPVRGIYLNYQDENTQSQSPVYEFKTPEDAQKFALQVNESGYSLSIVNGKLLAMTGSKYGIVLNDKENATIEGLLKSSVMAYEEPAPPPVSSSKDYAGACTRIDAMLKAVDKLVNKSVLVYSKTLPAGDPGKNITFVTFTILSSPDMSYTSALCEDQAKMDEVVKTWELFGGNEVKLKHNAANDYTLTGKRMGVENPFDIRCVYNPDKDSLRIVDAEGGETVEMLEFVPLGQDRYAFQTLYERGIVGYKDGKITSLTYSVNRKKELANKPDADGIYPDGKGVDDTWASKLGEDKYEQFVTFDGSKLKISATDFTGNVLKVETEVK